MVLENILNRIINQMLPDSGSIILDGEKLQSKHVQYIGYLPERVYNSMKVESNVCIWHK
jgi:ABC-2 type transport system ATP-binding protein